jgi:hypothetical protein
MRTIREQLGVVIAVDGLADDERNVCLTKGAAQ